MEWKKTTYGHLCLDDQRQRLSGQRTFQKRNGDTDPVILKVDRRQYRISVRMHNKVLIIRYRPFVVPDSAYQLITISSTNNQLFDPFAGCQSASFLPLITLTLRKRTGVLLSE